MLLKGVFLSRALVPFRNYFGLKICQPAQTIGRHFEQKNVYIRFTNRIVHACPKTTQYSYSSSLRDLGPCANFHAMCSILFNFPFLAYHFQLYRSLSLPYLQFMI